MEPFSIATGIFACFTAAELLGKCSRMLHHNGRKIKGAEADIVMFSNEVGIFRGVIESACIAMEPFAATRNDEDSHAIQYLIERHVLARLIKQFELVTDEIYDYIPVIRKLRKIPKLLVILKWISRKKEIEAITARMESVKSSFLVVQNSVMLEALRLKPRTKVLRREMKVYAKKRLKRELSIHVKKVEILQAKIEANSRFSIGESEQAFVSLNFNVPIALHNLGTSLVNERRVPGYAPPPVPPTASSMDTESRTPVEDYNSRTFEINASPLLIPSRNSSTRHQRSSSITTEPSTNPDTSLSIPTLRALEPSNHQFPPSPTVLQTPKPNSTSSIISAISINNSTTPIERMPTPPPESDFFAVHESSNLLHLDPSTNYQAEAGYIIRPSGYLSVTAKLDENLGENLITQAFAVEHDIDIEPVNLDESDEEGVWVQIGAGKKERCVGKVRLRWSMGREIWKPEFPVHCWVCVHGDGDLVFGRRFVERKVHYQRGEEG